MPVVVDRKGARERGGGRPRRSSARPRARAGRARARPAERDRGRARGAPLAPRRPPPSAAAPGRAAGRGARTRRPARPARLHDRPRGRQGFRRRAVPAARGRRRCASGSTSPTSSAFVPAGSPLDRDAAERAFSVYVPGRVEPMLPEQLSADLCSLRPDADRRCVTVEVPFDAESRPGRADVLPEPDPEPRAAHLRASRGDPRGSGAGGGRPRRGARARRAVTAELRRRRFARGALRIETGEIDVRLRRRGRRRAGLDRERAARAHAGRGVDDPRERGRGRAPRRRGTARRSSASTSDPTRRRSSSC